MVHAEKDSGRPCPMLHPVAGLIHIVSLIFFFFEKRKIDSMIRELKRKDFIYSMNFYFFFFLSNITSFSLNTCTSPMPEYSQIYCNYILLCTLVTDKLDFKQARSIKGLSPHPLRILDLIPT